ncbi:hypothetical protein CAI16_07255 [Virgibacillus dokdonensis]|uniref:Endospore appendages core domain-containing protein n=1 Tax=Virgibacillus dokdonensis TaxID=302167 RepID=A0A3E0WS87_9BACI|nr:S-Ena type endospore appendage [Virgibacillus dokdonensis]RFA35840.1 hypothetical protein CAI16_07255 [Virgibacillus dokdonensis]
MSNRPKTQCVRVNQVYDWINQITNIKLKEKVPLKKGKCFQDNICLKYNVPCDGSKSILWNGADVKDFIGTFVITVDKHCNGEIELFVNGESMTSLTGGQSFGATIKDLQLIEIQCQDDPSIDYCKGTLDIQLVSKMSKAEEYKEIRCFLSDHQGNPLEPTKNGSICCMEQSNPADRRSTEIMMNGNVITLQEIAILIKGFITVQFINNQGQVCGTYVYPFWEIETFYLCAPIGTDVYCNVSKFHCKAEFVPHLEKCKCCINLSISISVCLSIYSSTNVTVELLGNECTPRSDVQNFGLKQSIPGSGLKVVQNTS